MSQHVLLNNVEHAHLRIDTRRSAELGDDVMLAPTFPGEFRNLQSYYPIVFRATDAGFQPYALLGLRAGENLFLEDDRWDAAYLPLAIERQPFLIGSNGEQAMIHVDLEHPRARAGSGEALFREHGGTTAYLDRIASVLRTLHDGLRVVPDFVEALRRHGLLAPFSLDVRLDDGTDNRLAGFHAIDEDRLRELDAAALGELHQAGHLEPVYMAVASLGQLRGLIERMNRRRAAGH